MGELSQWVNCHTVCAADKVRSGALHGGRVLHGLRQPGAAVHPARATAHPLCGTPDGFMQLRG